MMKFQKILFFAFWCAATFSAHSQPIIDPALDSKEALKSLATLDCDAQIAKTSYNAECTYAALTESAAYFDACLSILQTRHAKKLSTPQVDQFYAPLLAWQSLAPSSTRLAVLNKTNQLRQALTATITDVLIALDEDALTEACTRRIISVKRQMEPLTISERFWLSPRPSLSSISPSHKLDSTPTEPD